MTVKEALTEGFETANNLFPPGSIGRAYFGVCYACLCVAVEGVNALTRIAVATETLAKKRFV